MATTTAFIQSQNNPTVMSGVATIDAGETASLAIPSGGRSVVRIGIPTITSANLTFTVTPYPGATARTLKDAAGNTVTVVAGTGGFVAEVPALSGAYSFTIVSSVAQVSAAAFDVQAVGLDPAPFELAALGGYNTATYVNADVTAGTGSWTTAHSPLTIFTVTGTVLARVFGVVQTQLNSTAGTGTVAIGVAGATSAFIAATTANGTTNFVANAAWVDSTPTVTAEALAGSSGWTLTTGNIIATIATNDMTAGAITLYCQWIPVSAGARVA